ncbi:MAG: type II toxin-antitoxin system VapC family toxin [Alphaproteobacteria bacterium]|nr:type II toxin-antitoxin system VapC family toxin [Alphaproteobacteria bacterium]
MRLLLDTHVLIWWVIGEAALTTTAENAIRDPGNEVLVSAASAWEIATKHRIGKLPQAGPLALAFEASITSQGFTGLPIAIHHGAAAGRLPGPHRDPFDRMLIAQALAESLTLVSNERVFDRYGVARLW